jgi:tricarballylate dehydrogenase
VEGRITGIRVRAADGGQADIEAGSVVLASGGFEADASRRAAYLGAGWDLARVRGTPYDTGDPLFLAIGAGAATAGHWSGCHAIAWDAAAPDHGDRVLTNRFSRQSYPFGLIVNRDGERFVDEGADFRNYTYAKYGAEIMRQPGAVAFHLFDTTTAPFIGQVDYSTAVPGRSLFEAGSIEELAEVAGIDRGGLERSIVTFNAAVGDAPFDPTVKDGRGALGIEPPKTNWAQRYDAPPYLAYKVTCGITFTFGGLRIDTDGRVVDVARRPIRGLYAAGEIVGGLFHNNYPGGSGLTSGTVFGRRAGATAARETRA